jgi:predicted DNA-binding transcriptional regulator YafY
MNRHAFEDWEIKVMMDAVQQAKCVSANEAKIIREKLLDLTSERGRQRISHMIIPSDNNLKVDTKLGEYIEIMMEAMYQGRKIKFQYTRRGDKMEKILRRNGEYYIFNLYAIYWSSNNYYLIGAHDHRDELTNYRLDRVENLSMTEEYAIEAEKKIGHNPEMFIRKYIDESVAHFSGKPIRIEVEYEANQVTNAILYDFVGNDIRIRKRRDGKNVAGFTKLDGITLTHWFVQYADMFKVIKPENLKMHVIEQLNKGMEHYKE